MMQDRPVPQSALSYSLVSLGESLCLRPVYCGYCFALKVFYFPLILLLILARLVIFTRNKFHKKPEWATDPPKLFILSCAVFSLHVNLLL